MTTRLVHWPLIEQTIARAQAWSFGDPDRIDAWVRQFVEAHQRFPGGLSLEIGTWKGGTALVLCEVLELLYHARSRPMLFTVDPYGDKPYDGGDSTEKPALFGNTDYVGMKDLLAPYPHHAHFYQTSTQFLQTVAGTGIYWWRGQARKIHQFTFALVDGEHSAAAIGAELAQLLPHMAPGGVVIVDNVDNDPETIPQLRHSSIEAAHPHLKGWHARVEASKPLRGQQWATLRRY
jgi:hypothetical protein